jgi:hypothetical protein
LIDSNGNYKSDHGIDVEVQFQNADDSNRGKIYLSLQASQVIGSITFWNTGSVTAHLIHPPSKTEYMLDDRQLAQ